MQERAGYEVVIGLEVHAQLLTKTKLFSNAPVRHGTEPNTAISPLCVGLPGTLPVLNRRAVELAAHASFALELKINEVSVFERKHYFYPDLPKGYQISQLRQPFSEHGHVDLEVDGERVRIGITRLQLEEDAAKNVHSEDGRTAVDYNRAGTPLAEIVSEPDMRSSAQAEAYLRELRQRLMFAGVNDGNLELGSFRCDANVSVRPVGQSELGTRVELKNINSFRFVRDAIEYEIDRQIGVCESGGSVDQETRGWDEESGKSFRMRGKEDAEDYRYFPDPDLPPIRLTPGAIEDLHRSLPTLPSGYEELWKERLSLSEEQLQALLQHPAVARFFEEVVAGKDASFAERAANMVRGQLLSSAKFEGQDATFCLSPKQLRELIELVESDVISARTAKEVFDAVSGTEDSPSSIVRERGLEQLSDSSALESIVDDVIESNPGPLAQYRAGKTAVLGFFMGQVMKASGGTANPETVKKMLQDKLSEGA